MAIRLFSIGICLLLFRTFGFPAVIIVFSVAGAVHVLHRIRHGYWLPPS